MLCGEPCHERWRFDDAAQVPLIRRLLALTGFWYDPEDGRASGDDVDDLARHIGEIHAEYLHERDPHEAGQSPNDNACTGEAILAALGRHLVEVDRRPTCSFIYRVLGGLRGPREVIHPIADLLAAYDRLGVERGFLRPNGFMFMGRPS